MTAYYLNVTVHLLAALVWLGGMLFFALVGAPVLRKVDDPALRARLFQALGTQFRWVGWICIVVLLVTGVGNLHFRGFVRWEILGDPAFWSGGYGRTLGWKLTAVGVMVVASAIHDFWLGPKAGTLRPGSPEALRTRRLASWLGRINALVGIILVFVAVRLARGG